MNEQFDMKFGLPTNRDTFNCGFSNLSISIYPIDNATWQLDLFEFFSQLVSSPLEKWPANLLIRVDNQLRIFVQYDSNEWVAVGSPLPIPRERLPQYPLSNLAMDNFFAQHVIHPPLLEK